jgi:hypothetical protein
MKVTKLAAGGVAQLCIPGRIPAMKITPKETNIGSIFSSNFLIIPRFQRPYSWDKDNIQEFWEDIFSS